MQQLYVYRCNKKSGTYLFLPQKDHFKKIPDELLTLLGELSFSFEFKLDKNKQLIQVSAVDVLKAIETHGFYLQLSSKRKPQKKDKLSRFYQR